MVDASRRRDVQGARSRGNRGVTTKQLSDDLSAAIRPNMSAHVCRPRRTPLNTDFTALLGGNKAAFDKLSPKDNETVVIQMFQNLDKDPVISGDSPQAASARKQLAKAVITYLLDQPVNSAEKKLLSLLTSPKALKTRGGQLMLQEFLRTIAQPIAPGAGERASGAPPKGAHQLFANSTRGHEFLSTFSKKLEQSKGSIESAFTSPNQLFDVEGMKEAFTALSTAIELPESLPGFSTGDKESLKQIQSTVFEVSGGALNKGFQEDLFESLHLPANLGLELSSLARAPKELDAFVDKLVNYPLEGFTSSRRTAKKRVISLLLGFQKVMPNLTGVSTASRLKLLQLMVKLTAENNKYSVETGLPSQDHKAANTTVMVDMAKELFAILSARPELLSDPTSVKEDAGGVSVPELIKTLFHCAAQNTPSPTTSSTVAGEYFIEKHHLGPPEIVSAVLPILEAETTFDVGSVIATKKGSNSWGIGIRNDEKLHQGAESKDKHRAERLSHTDDRTRIVEDALGREDVELSPQKRAAHRKSTDDSLGRAGVVVLDIYDLHRREEALFKKFQKGDSEILSMSYTKLQDEIQALRSDYQHLKSAYQRVEDVVDSKMGGAAYKVYGKTPKESCNKYLTRIGKHLKIMSDKMLSARDASFTIDSVWNRGNTDIAPDMKRGSWTINAYNPVREFNGAVRALKEFAQGVRAQGKLDGRQTDARNIGRQKLLEAIEKFLDKCCKSSGGVNEVSPGMTAIEFSTELETLHNEMMRIQSENPALYKRSRRMFNDSIASSWSGKVAMMDTRVYSMVNKVRDKLHNLEKHVGKYRGHSSGGKTDESAKGAQQQYDVTKQKLGAARRTLATALPSMKTHHAALTRHDSADPSHHAKMALCKEVFGATEFTFKDASGVTYQFKLDPGILEPALAQIRPPLNDFAVLETVFSHLRVSVDFFVGGLRPPVPNPILLKLDLYKSLVGKLSNQVMEALVARGVPRNLELDLSARWPGLPTDTFENLKVYITRLFEEYFIPTGAPPTYPSFDDLLYLLRQDLVNPSVLASGAIGPFVSPADRLGVDAVLGSIVTRSVLSSGTAQQQRVERVVNQSELSALSFEERQNYTALLLVASQGLPPGNLLGGFRANLGRYADTLERAMDLDTDGVNAFLQKVLDAAYKPGIDLTGLPEPRRERDLRQIHALFTPPGGSVFVHQMESAFTALVDQFKVKRGQTEEGITDPYLNDVLLGEVNHLLKVIAPDRHGQRALRAELKPLLLLLAVQYCIKHNIRCDASVDSSGYTSLETAYREACRQVSDPPGFFPGFPTMASVYQGSHFESTSYLRDFVEDVDQTIAGAPAALNIMPALDAVQETETTKKKDVGMTVRHQVMEAQVQLESLETIMVHLDHDASVFQARSGQLLHPTVRTNLDEINRLLKDNPLSYPDRELPSLPINKQFKAIAEHLGMKGRVTPTRVLNKLKKIVADIKAEIATFTVDDPDLDGCSDKEDFVAWGVQQVKDVRRTMGVEAAFFDHLAGPGNNIERAGLESLPLFVMYLDMSSPDVREAVQEYLTAQEILLRPERFLKETEEGEQLSKLMMQNAKGQFATAYERLVDLLGPNEPGARALLGSCTGNPNTFYRDMLPILSDRTSPLSMMANLEKIPKPPPGDRRTTSVSYRMRSRYLLTVGIALQRAFESADTPERKSKIAGLFKSFTDKSTEMSPQHVADLMKYMQLRQGTGAQTLLDTHMPSATPPTPFETKHREQVFKAMKGMVEKQCDAFYKEHATGGQKTTSVVQELFHRLEREMPRQSKIEQVQLMMDVFDELATHQNALMEMMAHLKSLGFDETYENAAGEKPMAALMQKVHTVSQQVEKHFKKAFRLFLETDTGFVLDQQDFLDNFFEDTSTSLDGLAMSDSELDFLNLFRETYTVTRDEGLLDRLPKDELEADREVFNKSFEVVVGRTVSAFGQTFTPLNQQLGLVDVTDAGQVVANAMDDTDTKVVGTHSDTIIDTGSMDYIRSIPTIEQLRLDLDRMHISDKAVFIATFCEEFNISTKRNPLELLDSALFDGTRNVLPELKPILDRVILLLLFESAAPHVKRDFSQFNDRTMLLPGTQIPQSREGLLNDLDAYFKGLDGTSAATDLPIQDAMLNAMGETLFGQEFNRYTFDRDNPGFDWTDATAVLNLLNGVTDITALNRILGTMTLQNLKDFLKFFGDHLKLTPDATAFNAAVDVAPRRNFLVTMLGGIIIDSSVAPTVQRGFVQVQANNAFPLLAPRLNLREALLPLYQPATLDPSEVAILDTAGQTFFRTPFQAEFDLVAIDNFVTGPPAFAPADLTQVLGLMTDAQQQGLLGGLEGRLAPAGADHTGFPVLLTTLTTAQLQPILTALLVEGGAPGTVLTTTRMDTIQAQETSKPAVGERKTVYDRLKAHYDTLVTPVEQTAMDALAQLLFGYTLGEFPSDYDWSIGLDNFLGTVTTVQELDAKMDTMDLQNLKNFLEQLVTSLDLTGANLPGWHTVVDGATDADIQFLKTMIRTTVFENLGAAPQKRNLGEIRTNADPTETLHQSRQNLFSDWHGLAIVDGSPQQGIINIAGFKTFGFPVTVPAIAAFLTSHVPQPTVEQLFSILESCSPNTLKAVLHELVINFELNPSDHSGLRSTINATTVNDLIQNMIIAFVFKDLSVSPPLHRDLAAIKGNSVLPVMGERALLRTDLQALYQTLQDTDVAEKATLDASATLLFGTTFGVSFDAAGIKKFLTGVADVNALKIKLRTLSDAHLRAFVSGLASFYQHSSGDKAFVGQLATALQTIPRPQLEETLVALLEDVENRGQILSEEDRQEIRDEVYRVRPGVCRDRLYTPLTAIYGPLTMPGSTQKIEMLDVLGQVLFNRTIGNMFLFTMPTAGQNFETVNPNFNWDVATDPRCVNALMDPLNGLGSPEALEAFVQTFEDDGIYSFLDALVEQFAVNKPTPGALRTLHNAAPHNSQFITYQLIKALLFNVANGTRRDLTADRANSLTAAKADMTTLFKAYEEKADPFSVLTSGEEQQGVAIFDAVGKAFFGEPFSYDGSKLMELKDGAEFGRTVQALTLPVITEFLEKGSIDNFREALKLIVKNLEPGVDQQQFVTALDNPGVTREFLKEILTEMLLVNTHIDSPGVRALVPYSDVVKQGVFNDLSVAYIQFSDPPAGVDPEDFNSEGNRAMVEQLFGVLFDPRTVMPGLISGLFSTFPTTLDTDQTTLLERGLLRSGALFDYSETFGQPVRAAVFTEIGDLAQFENTKALLTYLGAHWSEETGGALLNLIASLKTTLAAGGLDQATVGADIALVVRTLLFEGDFSDISSLRVPNDEAFKANILSRLTSLCTQFSSYPSDDGTRAGQTAAWTACPMAGVMSDFGMLIFGKAIEPVKSYNLSNIDDVREAFTVMSVEDIEKAITSFSLQQAQDLMITLGDYYTLADVDTQYDMFSQAVRGISDNGLSHLKDILRGLLIDNVDPDNQQCMITTFDRADKTTVSQTIRANLVNVFTQTQDSFELLPNRVAMEILATRLGGPYIPSDSYGLNLDVTGKAEFKTSFDALAGREADVLTFCVAKEPSSVHRHFLVDVASLFNTGVDADLVALRAAMDSLPLDKNLLLGAIVLTLFGSNYDRDTNQLTLRQTFTDDGSGLTTETKQALFTELKGYHSGTNFSIEEKAVLAALSKTLCGKDITAFDAAALLDGKDLSDAGQLTGVLDQLNDLTDINPVVALDEVIDVVSEMGFDQLQAFMKGLSSLYKIGGRTVDRFLADVDAFADSPESKAFFKRLIRGILVTGVPGDSDQSGTEGLRDFKTVIGQHANIQNASINSLGSGNALWDLDSDILRLIAQEELNALPTVSDPAHFVALINRFKDVAASDVPVVVLRTLDDQRDLDAFLQRVDYTQDHLALSQAVDFTQLGSDPDVANRLLGLLVARSHPNFGPSDLEPSHLDQLIPFFTGLKAADDADFYTNLLKMMLFKDVGQPTQSVRQSNALTQPLADAEREYLYRELMAQCSPTGVFSTCGEVAKSTLNQLGYYLFHKAVSGIQQHSVHGYDVDVHTEVGGLTLNKPIEEGALPTDTAPVSAEIKTMLQAFGFEDRHFDGLAQTSVDAFIAAMPSTFLTSVNERFQTYQDQLLQANDFSYFSLDDRGMVVSILKDTIRENLLIFEYCGSNFSLLKESFETLLSACKAILGDFKQELAREDLSRLFGRLGLTEENFQEAFTQLVVVPAAASQSDFLKGLEDPQAIYATLSAAIDLDAIPNGTDNQVMHDFLDGIKAVSGNQVIDAAITQRCVELGKQIVLKITIQQLQTLLETRYDMGDDALYATSGSLNRAVLQLQDMAFGPLLLTTLERVSSDALSAGQTLTDLGVAEQRAFLQDAIDTLGKMTSIPAVDQPVVDEILAALQFRLDKVGDIPPITMGTNITPEDFNKAFDMFMKSAFVGTDKPFLHPSLSKKVSGVGAGLRELKLKDILARGLGQALKLADGDVSILPPKYRALYMALFTPSRDARESENQELLKGQMQQAMNFGLFGPEATYHRPGADATEAPTQFEAFDVENLGTDTEFDKLTQRLRFVGLYGKVRVERGAGVRGLAGMFGGTTVGANMEDKVGIIRALKPGDSVDEFRGDNITQKMREFLADLFAQSLTGCLGPDGRKQGLYETTKNKFLAVLGNEGSTFRIEGGSVFDMFLYCVNPSVLGAGRPTENAATNIKQLFDQIYQASQEDGLTIKEADVFSILSRDMSTHVLSGTDEQAIRAARKGSEDARTAAQTLLHGRLNAAMSSLLGVEKFVADTPGGDDSQALVSNDELTTILTTGKFSPIVEMMLRRCEDKGQLDAMEVFVDYFICMRGLRTEPEKFREFAMPKDWDNLMRVARESREENPAGRGVLHRTALMGFLGYQAYPTEEQSGWVDDFFAFSSGDDPLAVKSRTISVGAGGGKTVIISNLLKFAEQHLEMTKHELPNIYFAGPFSPDESDFAGMDNVAVGSMMQFLTKMPDGRVATIENYIRAGHKLRDLTVVMIPAKSTHELSRCRLVLDESHKLGPNAEIFFVKEGSVQENTAFNSAVLDSAQPVMAYFKLSATPLESKLDLQRRKEKREADTHTMADVHNYFATQIADLDRQVAAQVEGMTLKYTQPTDTASSNTLFSTIAKVRAGNSVVSVSENELTDRKLSRGQMSKGVREVGIPTDREARILDALSYIFAAKGDRGPQYLYPREKTEQEACFTCFVTATTVDELKTQLLANGSDPEGKISDEVFQQLFDYRTPLKKIIAEWFSIPVDGTKDLPFSTREGQEYVRDLCRSNRTTSGLKTALRAQFSTDFQVAFEQPIPKKAGSTDIDFDGLGQFLVSQFDGDGQPSPAIQSFSDTVGDPFEMLAFIQIFNERVAEPEAFLSKALLLRMRATNPAFGFASQQAKYAEGKLEKYILEGTLVPQAGGNISYKGVEYALNTTDTGTNAKLAEFDKIEHRKAQFFEAVQSNQLVGVTKSDTDLADLDLTTTKTFNAMIGDENAFTATQAGSLNRLLLSTSKMYTRADLEPAQLNSLIQSTDHRGALNGRDGVVLFLNTVAGHPNEGKLCCYDPSKNPAVQVFKPVKGDAIYDDLVARMGAGSMLPIILHDTSTFQGSDMGALTNSFELKSDGSHHLAHVDDSNSLTDAYQRFYRDRALRDIADKDLSTVNIPSISFVYASSEDNPPQDLQGVVAAMKAEDRQLELRDGVRKAILRMGKYIGSFVSATSQPAVNAVLETVLQSLEVALNTLTRHGARQGLKPNATLVEQLKPCLKQEASSISLDLAKFLGVIWTQFGNESSEPNFSELMNNIKHFKTINEKLSLAVQYYFRSTDELANHGRVAFETIKVPVSVMDKKVETVEKLEQDNGSDLDLTVNIRKEKAAYASWATDPESSDTEANLFHEAAVNTMTAWASQENFNYAVFSATPEGHVVLGDGEDAEHILLKRLGLVLTVLENDKELGRHMKAALKDKDSVKAQQLHKLILKVAAGLKTPPGSNPPYLGFHGTAGAFFQKDGSLEDSDKTVIKTMFRQIVRLKADIAHNVEQEGMRGRLGSTASGTKKLTYKQMFEGWAAPKGPLEDFAKEFGVKAPKASKTGGNSKDGKRGLQRKPTFHGKKGGASAETSELTELERKLMKAKKSAEIDKFKLNHTVETYSEMNPLGVVLVEDTEISFDGEETKTPVKVAFYMGKPGYDPMSEGNETLCFNFKVGQKLYTTHAASVKPIKFHEFQVSEDNGKSYRPLDPTRDAPLSIGSSTDSYVRLDWDGQQWFGAEWDNQVFLDAHLQANRQDYSTLDATMSLSLKRARASLAQGFLKQLSAPE